MAIPTLPTVSLYALATVGGVLLSVFGFRMITESWEVLDDVRVGIVEFPVKTDEMRGVHLQDYFEQAKKEFREITEKQKAAVGDERDALQREAQRLFEELYKTGSDRVDWSNESRAELERLKTKASKAGRKAALGLAILIVGVISTSLGAGAWYLNRQRHHDAILRAKAQGQVDRSNKPSEPTPNPPSKQDRKGKKRR